MKSMEYMREGAKEGAKHEASEGKGHELQEKVAGRKIGKQKMLGKAENKEYSKGKVT